MRSRLRAACAIVSGVFVLVFAARTAPIEAQSTTGSISGTVTDQSKAFLPGVTMEVKHAETGVTRTLVSDERGRYRALNLPPGTYTVTAELPGFAKVVRDNLIVALDKDVPVDIEMKVGNINEQVTVSGEATRVQLSTTVVGGLVTTKQIAELPLNGRNFMQLATLEPGVAVSRATTAGFTGGFGNTEVAISGARPEHTGYLLEGTNIADISDKAPSSMAGVMLGVDAVREFTVQTHGYSAEFGRAAGGIVSAVTKSGTNALHGTLFEFLRNSALDAKNFFDTGQKPPQFSRNQFGGTAGGPIVKNKLFFFGSYEGLRQRLGTTQLARLPNQAAHDGFLPVRPGSSSLTSVGVDPRVKPYLDLLFPLPNGRDFGDGTAELRHSETSPTTEDFYVGKIDWQVGSNDSFLVRISNDPSDTTSVRENPTFGRITSTKTEYYTAQQQHLFSNNVLNVVRTALNRTQRADDTSPLVNIPQSLYFTADPHFGAIEVTGLSAAGADATTPVLYDQHLYQFADTLTWNKGGHTMKFGVDVQRYHFDGYSYSRFGGAWAFRSLREFLTLTNGTGGVANTFTGNLSGTDTQRNMRQSYFAFFANDDFHISSRLTVNYGLRYEFVTTPYDTQGRVAGLLSLDDLESGPLGVTPGTPLFNNPSLKSFAPRLGFAWNPSANEKTSIKGGAGIFYQPLTTSFYRGTAFRIYPYFAGVSISRPTVFGPAVQQVLAGGTGLQVQKRSEFIYYDVKQPFIAQYYLNFQHELPAGLVGEIGYVGSRGYNLPFYGDPNSIPAQQAPDGQWQIVPGARLRYPSWGRVRTRINDARSFYDGAILKLNRQFHNGLMFQGSYTLSKSIDDWSGGQIGSADYDGIAGNATNWWCPRCERGLSNFDIRHNLVLNAVYVLPWGRNLKGLAGVLGAGWQAGAIFTGTSGIPFTPFIGFDRAGDKEPDGNGQKPSLAAGASNNPVRGTVDQWFDPLAFALPAVGYYGNLGRNTIVGPNLRELDLSLFKSNALGGNRTVQFRIEAFNLLNRPNFALPDVKQGLFDATTLARRPAAAQVTRTSTTSRQIQLALKILF